MSRAGQIGLLILAAGLALTGCKPGAQDKNKAPAGGKPALPNYQMRAEVAPGDRLHPTAEGKALFSNLCGACHLDGGMGTLVLTSQQVALGQPATMGLLVNREDLAADYVKSVVRMGKGFMPLQTRVDITDAELDKVAAYLGKGK
jgi:mono/diheme cytochrome c family protein